ncbi:nucleoside hydrolase [Lacticaseibacillus nasuensis]|uniref:Cytidine uridine-specific hydrolase n=1 Tax=Lacticaseibacillus nasuensis JCM 17158 TaxID=1291734 RepID=A0A0R1JS70_9LACO|nr:nucleoside hydrolase [Lacticaseibacillus nasuensis]KRK70538.1 cytidine uridine-specific hydrolase [Lacticaseibacillus nasuensis JCM 17158]
MSDSKVPVIISTDPGIDDAVAIAIALFSPKLDVQLIVPEEGNVSIEKTIFNTRRLLTFLNRPVRVVAGSRRPLLHAAQHAGNVHGETGMDGYPFPEPTVAVDSSVTAAQAMHEVVSSSNVPVTLIGIGPLTDLALFIHQYPDDLANVGEVVLMGGALGRGNLGVLTEFNFGTDPEAAKIVIDSGLKLRIAPMEVGREAKLMPETSEQLKEMGKVGDMFYALFSKYRGGSFKTGLHMYDALAMGLILDPDIFTTVDTYLAIETSGTLTAGASLFDLRGYLHQDANVTVATAVDTYKFKQWFVEAIRATTEEEHS